FRMSRPRRVGEETTIVGVLQKRSVEPWCARIGVIQTCSHAVNHDSPRTYAKELQRLLEAVHDRDRSWGMTGMDAPQPSVTQNHHETVDDTTPSAAQFLQQARLAEVHFRKLPRCSFDPPNRSGGLAETAVLAGKPVQRGIRQGQTLAPEQ